MIKKKGLSGPSSNNSLITTTYNGILIVDVVKNDNSRKLIFESDIKQGKMMNLDERLWLEGNLSIGYGRNISEDGDIFSLKFNPEEVKQALNIPLESINMEVNSWFPGLFEKKPSQLVCFPYAQHFLSDSPGYSSRLINKDDLISATKSVDFSKISVFSTKSIKYMFIIGSIISFIITLILIILLIIK